MQAIKYGVISAKDLCKDLYDWNTFYVSGRMQKPVMPLKDDAEIVQASEQNLSSALNASLLLLPEHFSLEASIAQRLWLAFCHNCFGMLYVLQRYSVALKVIIVYCLLSFE